MRLLFGIVFGTQLIADNLFNKPFAFCHALAMLKTTGVELPCWWRAKLNDAIASATPIQS